MRRADGSPLIHSRRHQFLIRTSSSFARSRIIVLSAPESAMRDACHAAHTSAATFNSLLQRRQKRTKNTSFGKLKKLLLMFATQPVLILFAIWGREQSRDLLYSRSSAKFPRPTQDVAHAGVSQLQFSRSAKRGEYLVAYMRFNRR